MLWTRLPEKLRTATVCYHRYMTKVGSKEIPMNVELEKMDTSVKKIPPLQQQYTAQTCRANKKGNILNLCSWKPNKFAKLLPYLFGYSEIVFHVHMSAWVLCLFYTSVGFYVCMSVCATTWRVTSVFMVSMVFLLIQTQYRKSNITNIRTCDVRTPWCYY